MITKSDGLIDDLTFMIINHMHINQFIQMDTDSVKVTFRKNSASLLSNHLFLQDSSQIKLDSTFCNILGLTSQDECSNKVITQRVNFYLFKLNTYRNPLKVASALICSFGHKLCT